jgi:hypothetical protein
MKGPAHRRCAHCRRSFVPDYRNLYHQRFCSQPACQHASKQTSQHRWLRKPGNRHYFRAPEHLERVQDWRRVHPGYWRAVKHTLEPDSYATSAPAPVAETTAAVDVQSGTLQDFCRIKVVVITELISRLSRCALQEDIALCVNQVVSEAQCILLRCKSSVLSGTVPTGQVNYHESG